MSKIRVLLADDHAILRAGVALLISQQDDMEVVAEAGDAEEAVARVEELAPDVAVLDISMPKGGGVSAAERIRASDVSTRVIALTMHDDPAYLKAAFAAGTLAFVVKRSADTHLLDAIRSVVKNQLYIDPALGAGVLQGLLEPMRVAPTESDKSNADNLSLRERQVLTLLAHGYTNREAAEKLGLSMRSVETYRSRMADKLGFQSRVDLVRYALEMGWLKQGEPL